jgi:hypothetical protein
VVLILTSTESFTDAFLLQTTQIIALSKPRDVKLRALKEWLVGSNGGNNFQRVAELLETWDKAFQQHDLVGLHQPPADDEGIARILKPGVRAAYVRVASYWRRKKVRDLTIIVVRSTVH